jgi:hypothetical protein
MNQTARVTETPDHTLPRIGFDEEVAQRMVAAALLNLRRIRQGQGSFKTWPEMSDVEQGFYMSAVDTAYRAIWEGR